MILRKLNLLEKGKLRRAALLLFGKDPKKFYISAYIKIGKFANDTDIISTDDIEGNLFEQVEKAIEILRVKYLVSNITYEGIYRKDNLEFPEEALREALINIVIHRSYMGAHTQLKISPEGLNLWNNGGLPSSIGIDDLKKQHKSKPRNEFLADVFFKAGMIEAWGRGTIKIVDECKKAGLLEPEFREEFGGFSVYFRKAARGEKRGERVGDKVGDKVGEKISLNQRKIIEFIEKDASVSARELAGLIGISQRKIEENIAKLKAKGLLERMGPDKGGVWRVNG
ncbi:MAG: ATP-binding protein [bacterium]